MSKFCATNNPENFLFNRFIRLFEACKISQWHSNLTGQVESCKRLFGSDRGAGLICMAFRAAAANTSMYIHISDDITKSKFPLRWLINSLLMIYTVNLVSKLWKAPVWWTRRDWGGKLWQRFVLQPRLTCAGSWGFGWWRHFLHCSSGRHPSVAGCRSRYVSEQWSPWETTS